MKKIILITFVLTFTFYLFGASVNVDELNIIADSHFNPNSQNFEVNTYFKFISSFDGGYKFAARVEFEANVMELERQYSAGNTDYYNNVFMIFRHAEVAARNLADSHFSLSFWTGRHGYLGDGNKYRGFLYYPESINEDYEGFYRLRGTGISAEIKFWQERFKAEFHFYENTNFISPATPNVFHLFSFDTSIGLYFIDIPIENDHFSLTVEMFGGITFPVNPVGQYKGGMSFSVGNDYVDFFVSFGIPKITYNTPLLGFDNFFLAADLHFKLFITDHTVSFLTRPLWFNEQLYGNGNGEKTDIDVNYKFQVLIPDFPINGGFDANFQYSLNDPNDIWNFILSPFMNVVFSGVIWNVAVHYDFSRIYIANITTSNDYKIYMEGFKVIVGASSKF